MLDNVLWAGQVADENLRETDIETKALYTVTQMALNDSRFQTHSIMFSDGLCIA